jgi:ketosteroid isomerase-like protein
MFIKYLMVITLLLMTATGHSTDQEKGQQHPALQVMERHLKAVSDKDLSTLAETLSPDGQMQLILPQAEIMDGTAAFLKFHEDWFASPDWTFETRILNSRIGPQLAMVVVEIIYREPERDGQPYFNRMIVSYDLALTDGQWYVIKDHASSVQKSTDQTPEG